MYFFSKHASQTHEGRENSYVRERILKNAYVVYRHAQMCTTQATLGKHLLLPKFQNYQASICCILFIVLLVHFSSNCVKAVNVWRCQAKFKIIHSEFNSRCLWMNGKNSMYLYNCLQTLLIFWLFSIRKFLGVVVVYETFFTSWWPLRLNSKKRWHD
jgi:hypothetical protein